MKNLHIAIVLLWLVFPVICYSDMFYDGADLKHMLDIEMKTGHRPLSSLDVVKVGRLQGFITGVNDALSGSEFCPPKAATLGDMINVVRQFVDLHMERWQEPAVVLAAEALAKEYPCKSKSYR